jgi:alpha-ketoglutarate-dependent taurine dioxygenase
MANGEGWHSDVSCDLEPPMGSILYIKQCPPHGGDTLFASMYAAYDALSDRMKAYLHELTAVHDGEPVYRGLYADAGIADKPVYPRAEHPVVRTHPVTGKKGLYVNRGFTHHIAGIPRDEKRRHAGLFVSARRESALPMPLPLDRECNRLLG